MPRRAGGPGAGGRCSALALELGANQLLAAGPGLPGLSVPVWRVGGSHSARGAATRATGEALYRVPGAASVRELDKCRTSVKSLGAGQGESTLGSSPSPSPSSLGAPWDL